MKLVLQKFAKKYFPSAYNKLRQVRYEKKVLPPHFLKHVNRLPKGTLVLDIGANVGLVTEVLARRGLRVISFEPNFSAFEKLKDIASKYRNIEIRNQAAGLKNSKIKLFLHKDSVNTINDLSQASSLLENKPNVSRDNYEIVEEIDFAVFLKSLNEPVELIKMDIEGYEIQLINHLLDQDAVRNVCFFYVETHERKFMDLVGPTNELKERIKAEGYEKNFFFDWH